MSAVYKQIERGSLLRIGERINWRGDAAVIKQIRTKGTETTAFVQYVDSGVHEWINPEKNHTPPPVRTAPQPSRSIYTAKGYEDLVDPFTRTQRRLMIEEITDAS